MENFLYSVHIVINNVPKGYPKEYHLVVEAYSMKGLYNVVEDYIHNCGFDRECCEVVYGPITITEEDNILSLVRG